MTNKPHFIIISSTNGSGKSSFGETLSQIGKKRIPFLDTDMLYKAKYGEYREYTLDEMKETSKEIAKTRDYFLKNKKSFIVEKIISNKDEILHLINQAKEHGFNTTLIYLGLDTLDESYRRIENRLSEGRHNVDPEVVKKNLQNSISNFKAIAESVNNVAIYDNTEATHPFKKVYDERNGFIKFVNENPQPWVMELIGELGISERLSDTSLDENGNNSSIYQKA